MTITTKALLYLSLLALSACGEDADSLGIAAQCTKADECNTDNGQTCLLDFKGGYCSIESCMGDADCPANSACVSHDNGTNYCFRTCTDKGECNENRDVDNEANCSSSVTFIETQESGVKACVPPSS